VLGFAIFAHTENGVYSLELPAPGTYNVKFSHLAFRDTVISGVVVNDQEFTVLDVVMTLNGFLIIFGNRDGSVMTVQAGTTIEIPIWGVTPAGNFEDSVIFMYVPLSSDDEVVTVRYPSREGDPRDTLPYHSYFPDTLVGLWDDRAILNPNPDTTPGRTNQDVYGFAYITDPRDPHNFFWTNGDTVLIATYVMRLSGNPQIWGDTVCPFQIGFPAIPWSPGLAWGMQDGITLLMPFATFQCLHVLEPPPCVYIAGDINNNDQANGLDVSYGVNYFKGFGPPPPVICENCPDTGQQLFGAGDVNGSCQFNGVDITYFVNFLKGVGPPLGFCPVCPPSDVAK